MITVSLLLNGVAGVLLRRQVTQWAADGLRWSFGPGGVQRTDIKDCRTGKGRRVPSELRRRNADSETRLWMRDSLILIEECYRRAFANSISEVQGVPIGKPDAAMRLRFADLLRMRRPMDAITRLG